MSVLFRLCEGGREELAGGTGFGVKDDDFAGTKFCFLEQEVPWTGRQLVLWK